MSKKELTFQQKRIESLYERELRIIVYQLTRRKGLPFLPISYCKADKKFQTFKVYVQAEENSENKKLVELFNRSYIGIINEKLVETKKFRKLPKVFFTFDKELNRINKLEEITRNI